MYSLLLKISYLCVSVLGSCFSLPVEATEIYRFVDEKGVINFTDHPINGSSLVRQVKSRPKMNSIKIYRFVDEAGVVHFTDNPKDSRYKLIYQGSQMIQPLAGKQYRSSARKVLHKRYFEYDEVINEIAGIAGLEPALLHAVIHTESAYNPKAVSPKGATGLMQLMPATAERYGVTDRTDVWQNMWGGARFLRDLLDMFDNDLRLALAGYNAGENAVKRYGYKIPPYKETKNYVKKVMSLYDTYRLH